MKSKNFKYEVTRAKLLDMQVCIPKDWTDYQVIEFAESRNPSGTKNGWMIRKEGNKLLIGDPERQPCEEHEGFVHIMLDVQEMYTVKWSRKDCPYIGQIVEWLDYRFKIIEIKNLRNRVVDTGEMCYEFIHAELIVEPLNIIEDNYDDVLKMSDVYVKPI